jgi:hypothetical protein
MQKKVSKIFVLRYNYIKGALGYLLMPAKT